jgi:hypothetical protein
MPLVVPMIIITLHTNEHGIYKLFTWHAYMAPLFMLLHYEKKGVLQLALNSIFELHWTFAIHYIYNAIHYNSITIFSQLLFNYYGTPL